MRTYKKLFALAIGACSFFAACDNGSTTDPLDKSIDTPSTPVFKVSSCQEVTDATVAMQLESAKSNIDDILVQLGEGNLKNAQVVSAQTKSSFKSVLDKYPSNCEAQLGYALSIITDLINNKQIKAYVDTLTNKQNLADLGIRDVNQLLIAGNGKHLSTMSQEAIAQAIPSLDSAIIYMKNIVSDDNFICHYVYDGKLFELDRGEFAPALSVLYVAKAILTFASSINLNISKDNRYDWINDLIDSNGMAKSVADQIASLLNKNSSFTTVHSNWQSRYKDIPNLIDTAITYVEIGLQYGIEESKSGTLTQMNDPYIVGDDEMADVSASDFQKAIDSLEYYRQKIHTGMTFTLPHGSKVKVNFAKFFDITDGWQDFLPYHKFNDYSQWYTPVDGFYWDSDIDYSYAEDELEKALYQQVSKNKKLMYFDASIYSYGGWDYDAPEIKVCLEYETRTTDAYSCYNAIANNCELSFKKASSYYDVEDNVSFVPSPIKLSSSVCKAENGQSLFAMPYREHVANALYFTDASGNKTISLQGLMNGYVDPVTQHSRLYNADEMKNFLFFPDITFGGILPEMTSEAFWEILKNEIRDDDDEKWYIDVE